MRTVDLDDFKEGDKVGEHVYFDDYFIVFSKYLTIKKSDLERARKYDLVSLRTISDTVIAHEKRKDKEPAPSEAAKPAYDILVSYLHTIFEACRHNKRVSLQIIHRVASLTAGYALKKREEALLRVARGSKSNRFESHSLNTGILAAIVAASVNIEGKELIDIVAGALFHDVGILFLGESKTRQDIEEHTRLGFKYLKTVEGVGRNVIMPALQHHEKADGSGYPDGLVLSDTAHSSRIVSICDSCDVQISFLRFGEDISLHNSRDELFAWKKEDFDVRLFRVFISAMSAIFEKERRVLLNDMSVAEVKKTSLRFPISPEVDLVADSKGQRPAERKTIELIKNKDLWIKRFLQK